MQRRPPTGYFCKRCGSPDHFVQHCPSFPIPPSSAHYSRPLQPASTAASQPAALAANGPPADLLCSLCHNLYHSPMVVPCCFTSFCDECIRQALLWEDSYTCPSCQHRPVSLEQLQPNDGLRRRVEEGMDSRGHRDDGAGGDAQQDQQRRVQGEASSGAEGDSAAVSDVAAAGDDDVSVILAEPSAGQLAHQARRDKQQNGNNSFRCFRCGEPGHRIAQCPTRHNQQPQQQPQQHPQQLQPMLPPGQPPMHDPYAQSGYNGGPMYNEVGLPLQPYGLAMAGGAYYYGGMMPMGPPMPVYDDWGSFIGMQPQPMPPQPFYNQPYVHPAASAGDGVTGVAGPTSHTGHEAPNSVAEADRAEMQPTARDATAGAAPTTSPSLSSSPPAAPPSALSSLLAVMPYVPPRSPPTSPSAAARSLGGISSTAASTAPSASLSSPAQQTASAVSATASPSPSASPPAAAAASPPSVAHTAATLPPAPSAPALTVVSYSYVPSTWNEEPRPLLLCVLSNHLRTFYAPSALLGSAFRLTQQLAITPLHRVTADGVPPKGNRSSLLLTREGMVEWKRREGEGGGVAMADDWKGKGGGWERVVEWMRGERTVRMVKAGEEWTEEKEEVKAAEAPARAEEKPRERVDDRSEQRGRVVEVERTSSKRKVETDSHGRLHVKVHRRDRDSSQAAERERSRERERARAAERERERPRDDDSAEGEERRRRKRGGRREREKRERKDERQRAAKHDDGSHKPEHGRQERT